MASWDLAGSFVIGGLVLLILMGIFFYYTTYSQHNLQNEMAQMDISTLNDVMERDMNNVGNVNGSGKLPTESILNAAKNDFQFQAQMNTSTNLEIVRYYTQVKDNDTLLTRYSNETGSDKDWTMKVSRFKFSYLNASGAATTTLGDIRSINVEFIYNAITTDDKSDYSKKLDNIPLKFQRKYYPKNLYQ